MNYVGIDHHRQYSHITWLDEKGEVVKSGRVGNLRRELEEFLQDSLSTGTGDPEGVRGARCGGIHPDFPTALGEDHEKYSTEVSAATKYSWKAP